MAQFHYVIYFDTMDEKWHLDRDTDAYFPDGEAWDYAGSQMWQDVPEYEAEWYDKVGERLLAAANDLARYAYEHED